MQILVSGKYSCESASQLVPPSRRDARFFKTGVLVHAKQYVSKLGVAAADDRNAPLAKLPLIDLAGASLRF